MVPRAEHDVRADFMRQTGDRAHPEHRRASKQPRLHPVGQIAREWAFGIADHQRYPPPQRAPPLHKSKQRLFYAAAVERLRESEDMRGGGSGT